ncbi:EamA family transporter [Bradyrhizobium brasilense]|nr:EamA family transporter [Bradyrhizobium brasilense]
MLAFSFLGITWGSNFIFMKWASAQITPAQIVLLRVLVALPPLALFAFSQRALRWDHLRFVHHFVVMSLLATAIYYWAFAKGTQLLPSSIAGLLSGTAPLFTFLCSYLFLREERIGLASATGVVLGYLGVLLVMRPWSASGSLDPAGGGYMMLGSFCLGCSFVYARKFIGPLNLPGTALATYQMAFAAVFLLAVTDLDGINRIFSDTRAWVGVVLGLGLCGTSLAYMAYYFVVRQLGALAASSVGYIPPVVALLIGVFLAGDPIDALGYAAVSLILSGVVILQLRRR